MAKAAKKRGAMKGTESKTEERSEAKGTVVPYGAKGKNPFAGAASAAMKQKKK